MSRRVRASIIRRPRLQLVAVLAAVLSLMATTAAVAVPNAAAANGGGAVGDGPAGLVEAPEGAEVMPDSYVVVLAEGHPSQIAREHARRQGAEIRFVYEHSLRGYAATMPERAARAIARDPRVAWIEPETIETIQSQTLPTGVDRIDTDLNPTVGLAEGNGVEVDVPIAVIDTGIAEHADLNVGGRVDCTVRDRGGPFASYSCAEGQGDDGNGHGTHVAGTIGAKDNGQGVVGVAPGTPLWSVKVCPNSSCPGGAIIAGIDWVAGKKTDPSDGVDFAAANFSISSADSDSRCGDPANATHAAICGLVDTGVSFVMAAGNAGDVKVPYPVALSVSAIADFDGVAGGAGEPTCRTDEDDTLASFSNYGEDVRIAAPGVCILSTWNDGGYDTINGTSMAAPHVAGAVALYLHANGLEPAQDADGVRGIEATIIEAAHPQGTSDTNPCSYDDTRPGGPLLFVNAEEFGGDGDCGVAGQDVIDPDQEPEGPTASFTFDCTDLTCAFDGSSSGGEQLSYAWDFGDGNSGEGMSSDHTYASAGAYEVTLTVTEGEETDQASEDITVTDPDDENGDGEEGIELSATGYKVRGVKHADLSWSGATSTNVDIFRDGVAIATVTDDSYTDETETRGGGSHTYQVCESTLEGEVDPPVCSDEVTVSF